MTTSDDQPSAERIPATGVAGEGSAARSLHHLGRRLLVPVVLGVAALALLALVADAEKLRASLGRFDLRLLIPVLLLSLLNYLLRFLRWEVFLRTVGVRLKPLASLEIFLVGFVLSVTPGKAGELGKAWLAREVGGGRARRTVGVVLAERLSDILGVVAIIGLCALPLTRGLWIALATFLALALPIVLLRSPLGRKLLTGLGRFRRLRSSTDLLGEVYDVLRRLFAAKPLIVGLVLSCLAWGAEGVGFALVTAAYAPESSWVAGVLNYNLSTLAGALSMLPGGLLASEGALTALLGLQGLDTAAAASAAILIRVATLWFAVLLGLLAVPFVVRRLRKMKPQI